MTPDSQYFPQGCDLFVHHLLLLHRVSIQSLQVSFSKQRAQTHHLFAPVKHSKGVLINLTKHRNIYIRLCQENKTWLSDQPVVLNLVLNLRQDLLLQLRQRSPDVLLSM